MVMSESWASSLLHDVRRQRVMSRAGLLAIAGLLLGVSLLLVAGAGVDWSWLPVLGQELVGTSLTFLFVIVLIRQFMRDATVDDFLALRSKRFDQLTTRVRLSRDLCFSPSQVSDDIAKRVGAVPNYRPTPRLARAKPEEIQSYLFQWKFIPIPEDNAWYCVFSWKSEVGAPVARQTEGQPITFSLWQVGDQAHSGVFFDINSLRSRIGDAHTADLIERTKDLFLVPKAERPEAKTRHGTALVEVCRTANGLLLNLPMWDLMTSEAAHIITHIAIDVFEYLHETEPG